MGPRKRKQRQDLNVIWMGLRQQQNAGLETTTGWPESHLHTAAWQSTRGCVAFINAIYYSRVWQWPLQLEPPGLPSRGTLSGYLHVHGDFQFGGTVPLGQARTDPANKPELSTCLVCDVQKVTLVLQGSPPGHTWSSISKWQWPTGTF